MIQKAIPEHGLRLIDKAYDGDTFEIGAGKFSDTLLGCTISNSVVTILKIIIILPCVGANSLTPILFSKRKPALIASSLQTTGRNAGSKEPMRAPSSDIGTNRTTDPALGGTFP